MQRNNRGGGCKNSPLYIEQNEECFFTAANENTIDALASSLSSEEYINEVDRLYYWVSFYCFSSWVFLMSVSYWITWDRLEKLEGIEQTTTFLAALMVGMCCVITLLPQIRRGGKRKPSGIIIGALTVHFIAFATDMILASFPVPVMLNPVTKTKVYLLRWSEWAPLAFLMTFITDTCRMERQNKEGASISSGERISSLLSVMRNEYKEKSSTMKKDMNGTTARGESIRDDNDYSIYQEKELIEAKEEMKKLLKQELRPSYQLAWSQGLSTLCAWFFPLCNVWAYMILLGISVMLYFNILYRVYTRKMMLQKMEPGTSCGQKEMYVWAKLSFQLLRSCAILWTILLIVYFCYTFGPIVFPSVQLFQTACLTMVCEAIIDVLYKAIYMLVIVDVHEMIFAPKARTGRRLEELRQMIGVVWENSSDVICISVKDASGGVTTLLSPTYVRLYSESVQKDEHIGASRAVAFDLNASVFKNLKKISDKSLRTGDTNIIPTVAYDVVFDRDNAMFAGSSVSRETDQLASMAHLVARAWKAKEETNTRILMHDLVRMDGDGPLPIRCEANISIMEDNVMVIVVRDISERFRRFEVEKNVISETTARRKDAAANRFTRHEVKNGLLAAIGLCDSLADFSMASNTIQNDNPEVKKNNPGLKKEPFNIALASAVHLPNDNSHYVSELGKTLKEILDTVLAEAMARDVIHEVYEPKLEKVDLPLLLAIAANPPPNDARSKRYLIHTNISPLPEFSLDPQLWKYIHRNAVSNACKYGKASGTVTTELHWDELNKILKMDVINLPGKNHEEIMKLGDKASELIFSPRKRLSVHTAVDGNNHVSASHSAGDGAWIMHKCAKTLGGECTIKFEPERTAFSFQCPASIYDGAIEMQFDATFSLPPNIYGIAIDDSKIQRQLLKIFFDYINIPRHRSFIHGANASEITGFNDWALNFIYNHPNDYFLFIVDENLVIQEDQFSQHVTMSGSMSISNLRSKLLPDQENRVLALIRSANCSARDIAIYNSRAHGHITKEPIKQDTCIDIIAPHWIARFPKLQRMSSENLFGLEKNRKRDNLRNASWDQLTLSQDEDTELRPKKRSKTLFGLKRHDRNNNSGGSMSVSFSNTVKRPREVSSTLDKPSHDLKRKKDADDSDMSEGVTISDCWESIEEIDEYIASHQKDTLQWNIVWSKLHSLKGDLMMIERQTQNLEKGIAMVSGLKGDDLPLQFEDKWHEIRMMLCK